jgi:hypothetical protein
MQEAQKKIRNFDLLYYPGLKFATTFKKCAFANLFRTNYKFSVYLSNMIHKEKSNKMQQCIEILLFYIYMKLDMFRATHGPSLGA